MNKPKILYIIYSVGLAGTEDQLYQVCLKLKDKFDITVACPVESEVNKKFSELGIRIVNFEFTFKKILDIASFIRREGFDIIHNYLGKAEFIGTIAGKLAGVKYILSTKHFVDPNYTNKKFLKYYVSLVGHKVINSLNNKLIAVSESVKIATFKREKTDFYKIKTIYNGTAIEKKEVERRSGFRMGVISRLSEEKGLKYLIEAMPEIIKKYPNCECLIAGRGHLEPALRLMVNDLNLGDNVKFLGFVDNISEFLDGLDVFVLPAIEEPFGLAVIEAQMRGKPVIACNAAGPKEIIINGKSGLLVPPMDSSAISSGVMSLFKDREYAYNLALAGQKRALELFTASRMAKDTALIYEEMLGLSDVKEKKKVLVVGHHFVTKNNQRRIEELAKYDDLEISLLTPYWWREESRKVHLEKDYDKSYGIYKGFTLFTNHTALSFYIWSVYKLLWRIKPEIIDIYEEPWSLTTLQILIFKKLFLRGSKVMFYSAQNINKKYPFPFNLIERFTFNNADYCYPCSKGVEDVLRAKGYKGKISVVPLGLDACDEVKRDRNKVFTVGFVGRLVEEKGVVDLVNACNQLSRDYKLLIVGDGLLRDRITKMTKFRNIADKIEFTGAISRADMPKYYAKMDVLVAPSRTTAKWKEQFGRMITEAFMYGVPVIGSDSGSIPEVMAGCGIVYREGNVSKLRDAIMSIMNDEKARNEMIKRGREYALNNYTWARTTRMVKDIYDELSN
jgi:glycosyltransferase involved in cell wall biosynthesis